VKKRGLWVGLLVFLLLWPATAVFAEQPVVYYDGGQIFVEEDVSLAPGEVFRGDIGVFDGDLTIPQGSTVTGDVFVTNGDVELDGSVEGSLGVINGNLLLHEIGEVRREVFGMNGDLEIAGRVGGDLSVMFGKIDLRSSAVVEGDVMVVSGSLEREPGAQIQGEAMPEIPLPKIPSIPEMPGILPIPELPPVPEIPSLTPPPVPEPPSPPMYRHQAPTFGQQIGRFVGRMFTAGFMGLMFIALAVLIVFIWPRATRQVADCIVALPVQSFGLGLLTFLIAIVLEAMALVLMILLILVGALLIGTVILIPFGLLLILVSVLLLVPVPLVLAGAMVLGWVGLAEAVGMKVLALLKMKDVSPLGAVLAGMLVTVPLAAILWIIQPACCAWPFIILLTSVGLGAVLHTRFGRQSCRQAGSVGEIPPLPMEAMDEEAGLPDAPQGSAS